MRGAARCGLRRFSTGRRSRVQILIVEHNRDLAGIWARFLARQGAALHAGRHRRRGLRRAARAAVRRAGARHGAACGEALAVADFATYRNPEMPIIPVTASGFFSDSAIFELIPNARGLLRAPLRPEDMAALVEHYGGRYASTRRERASSG